MENAMLMESTINQEENQEELSKEEIRQLGLKRISLIVSLISISKELKLRAGKMNKSKVNYIFSIKSNRAAVDIRMNEFRWVLAQIKEIGMRSDERVNKQIVEAVNNFQLFAKVEPKVKDLLKEL